MGLRLVDCDNRLLSKCLRNNFRRLMSNISRVLFLLGRHIALVLVIRVFVHSREVFDRRALCTNIVLIVSSQELPFLQQVTTFLAKVTRSAHQTHRKVVRLIKIALRIGIRGA